MKQISTLSLGLLLATTFLASCGRNAYFVHLNNGSKVKAYETADRKYADGDTVCIVQYGLFADDWSIDNRGNMKDTLTPIMRNDSVIGAVNWKIGVITETK